MQRFNVFGCGDLIKRFKFFFDEILTKGYADLFATNDPLDIACG